MTGPNPSHDPASALKEPVISYGAIVRDDPPADTHDEQASLLGRPRPGSRRPSLSVSMLSLSQDRRRQLLFIVLLVFIAICIDIGASMLVAPMQRIYESIICRDYYREHDPTMIGKDREVEEGLCKVPHVQLELAKLRAWLGLMESLPGLVLTIPYGILADRIGRKPVALMALAGYLMDLAWLLMEANREAYFYNVFPLYLLLIGPLFQCFGGSGAVFTSVATTMIADAVAPGQR
ncbi:MAG: hypothetical protein LQ340_007931 [Diploschistes diacapsis]|nr:MAG: hypothetical protein LQ340_007931 [Diploschistes diacapsis]